MTTSTDARVKPTLAIIGAGMAGSKLASELMSRYAQQYHIVLIGEEAQVGYNRIMLSSLLAKELNESDLALIDVPTLTQNGLTILAGSPVSYLNTQSKTLQLENGHQLQYDKLVFATGSRSLRIPLKGIDAPNVIGFRDLNDIDTMTSLPDGSNAVVIGGGLLGLEAAVGLAKRGHNVSVIHREGHLLNRQLDEKAAGMLQARLVSMGVQFYLNATSTEFVQKDGQAQALLLADGQSINASLFVLAIGITPEVSLAKAAGLKVNRAIEVNSAMETSIADHYAVGECCEFEGNLFGLVAPIWDQLATLADVIGGKSKPFQVEPTPTKLKVSGVNLFSVGDIDPENAQNSIEYVDEGAQHYRKLVIENAKLVGVLLYGDIDDSTWYYQLMQDETDVTPLLDDLIFGERYCKGAQDVA